MRFEGDRTRITVQTPCKINPFLEVLERRSDGYHNLDTVMIAVDLFDEIEFNASDSTSIELHIIEHATWDNTAIQFHGLHVEGPTDSNIICRAAQRLLDELSIQRGLRILLKKSIPVRAGLGGGSSDAAATLVAAQLLWTGRYDALLAEKIAAELGSDINFFLQSFSGGRWAARCSSRGEIVQPIENQSSNVWLICCPKDGCSTNAVFQGLKTFESCSNGIKSANQFIAALKQDDFSRMQCGLFNRLFESARTICPTINDLSAKLLTQKKAVSHIMSGSGSAIVIPCLSDEADRVAEELMSELQVPVIVAKNWVSESIPQQCKQHFAAKA